MTVPSFRVALLALGFLGCGELIDDFDPKVGGPVVSRCANVDSDPSTDISFSQQILPVLKGEAGPVGCTCHQPSDPNPIGFREAGLDLSSYAGLMAGGNNSRSTIVIPGAPCSSVYWQKISPGPPFGARMPFDGPPFLDLGTRQAISDWIFEGARDN